MIEGFEKLSSEQFETLKKGVSWISILIASADGKIDNTEKEWAEKITEIRSYSLKGDLIRFYQEVGKDFPKSLDNLIAELPDNKDERKAILTERIASINSILPLLETELSMELYESYKSFAKHVAKSSGGFLGMMSISKEEKALIDLPMLDELHFEEE